MSPKFGMRTLERINVSPRLPTEAVVTDARRIAAEIGSPEAQRLLNAIEQRYAIRVRGALGSPAWLRATADEEEELINALTSVDDPEDADSRRRALRLAQGLRDAAAEIERLTALVERQAEGKQ